MAGKPAARIVTGPSTDFIGCQGGVAYSLCAEKVKVVTPANPFNQIATEAGQAAAEEAGTQHRQGEATSPGSVHFSSPQQEPGNWQEIEAARKAAKADVDATVVSAAQLLTPSSSWVLLGKLDRFGCTQHFPSADDKAQCGYFWQADSGARLTGVSFVRDLTSSDAVAAMHGARAANTPHSTSLERYSYSPERLFCMN